MSKDTGSLRTLTLRHGQRTGDKMVMLTVSGNASYALSKAELDSFVDCIRSALPEEDDKEKLSIFLRIQQIAKGTPTQWYEMVLYGRDHITEELYVKPEEKGVSPSLKFTISPTAFFQPNTAQAERMYAKAIEMLELSSEDTVYDLYCGTGTLGILSSSFVKEVIGIEIVPEAVLDARENLKTNGIQNVTFYKGDVGKVLSDLKEEGAPIPSVVMVDPPRVGLDQKAIKNILALEPKQILYISCNPATQAENVADFVDAGYRLKSLCPVDQFPHTVHIENIAVLVRD